MADEKKGFLSKIFGSKTSCCCNMKIEEVHDDKPGQPVTKSGCCGGEKKKPDSK